MTKLGCLSWVLALALAACGSSEDGPPPLAEVDGTLSQIAVNATSIFGIDSRDGSLIELDRNGNLIGKLDTRDVVSQVVAYGDWVAWVEKEGTGFAIRRRRNGNFESMRPFTPYLVATPEGLFYSDIGMVAQWPWDGVPQRLASPGADARALAVDPAFAYTLEKDQSVVKYTREQDMKETLLPAPAAGVQIRDGKMAYRTGEGIRLRDLFTGFDRVVGAPPPEYPCDTLIAGTAVLCGKYRAMDGVTEELLADPVGPYTSYGRDVYWLRVKTGDEITQIRHADAEAPIEKED